MTVEVLAMGAHPDDVELGIGGTIGNLARQGHRVAILDLTRGEKSSRGTPGERAAEAEAAARILGACARENVGLPDGGVANTVEQRLRVIPFIRRFRPRIVLAPMAPDRHPDHAAAHALVRDAAYCAGLTRIETGHEPFRPAFIYHYHPYTEQAMPPFIVDISATFDAKLEALRAHVSQFHNPDYPGPSTVISSAAFWESIRARAAYWGSRIGCAYGEALFVLEPARLTGLPGLESGSEESR